MGMPRERSMPLVPEPFSRISRSKKAMLLGNRPMAERWGGFCPNLDIPQYRESLSDEKKAELNKRADTLVKRAVCNSIYSSSEFCREVSAWNDVFGLLYDDERFRMDKRPYEFLAVDKAGNKTVKKRIPDATIGLRSYPDYFLKRGFICKKTGCKEDHAIMQPDKRLSERDLCSMMQDPECGLVVDGVWGKTGLLFPFAVYEAKKRVADEDQAEYQISHACRTYLAMLDDLARNPDNVAEYQTEESSQYQLFAFTSCGSYWQVFIAWNELHDCTVETIWEGNIEEWYRAYDLICIVDQIQHYAVHRHRPFVMNHLEAWYTRHQKMIDPLKSAIRGMNDGAEYMDISGEDSDDSSNNSPECKNNSLDPHRDFDMRKFDSDFDSYINSDQYISDKLAEEIYLSSRKPVEWFRLKEESNNTRQQITNETRRYNRRVLEIAQASETPKEPETTPAQGRSPEAKVIETAKESETIMARGRPSRTRIPKTRIIKTRKSPRQGGTRGQPPKAKASKKRNT